jgi:hypothetical protein
MTYTLPGPKTAERLESGKKLFRHGLTYQAAAKLSAAKGFIPPAQIILDRAKGDYISGTLMAIVISTFKMVGPPTLWVTAIQKFYRRYMMPTNGMATTGSIHCALSWQKNWPTSCRASSCRGSPLKSLVPRQ